MMLRSCCVNACNMALRALLQVVFKADVRCPRFINSVYLFHSMITAANTTRCRSLCCPAHNCARCDSPPRNLPHRKHSCSSSPVHFFARLRCWCLCIYACKVRHDKAKAREIAWCLQLIDNRSIIAKLAPGNRNQNVVITKTGFELAFILKMCGI